MEKDAEHRQALLMLREVQKQHKESQRMDKMLVREVSKWVDTATGGGAANDADTQDSDSSDGSETAPPVDSLWSFFTCATLE